MSRLVDRILLFLVVLFVAVLLAAPEALESALRLVRAGLRSVQSGIVDNPPVNGWRVRHVYALLSKGSVLIIAKPHQPASISGGIRSRHSPQAIARFKRRYGDKWRQKVLEE